MRGRKFAAQTCWIHLYPGGEWGLKANYNPLYEGFPSDFDMEGNNLNELPRLECDHLIITTYAFDYHTKDEELPEFRKTITRIREKWVSPYS